VPNRVVEARIVVRSVKVHPSSTSPRPSTARAYAFVASVIGGFSQLLGMAGSGEFRALGFGTAPLRTTPLCAAPGSGLAADRSGLVVRPPHWSSHGDKRSDA